MWHWTAWHPHALCFMNRLIFIKDIKLDYFKQNCDNYTNFKFCTKIFCKLIWQLNYDEHLVFYKCVKMSQSVIFISMPCTIINSSARFCSQFIFYIFALCPVRYVNMDNQVPFLPFLITTSMLTSNY